MIGMFSPPFRLLADVIAQEHVTHRVVPEASAGRIEFNIFMTNINLNVYITSVLNMAFIAQSEGLWFSLIALWL